MDISKIRSVIKEARQLTNQVPGTMSFEGYGFNKQEIIKIKRKVIKKLLK